MILHGDCIEVMATFEPESIDAIVTDPPYGLEFMGKDWDNLWREKRGDPNGLAQAHAEATGRPSGNRGFSGQRGPEYKAGRPMQDWHEAWAREAFRVAKPGAHLLAFGGTRTYHRLAAAIEDAGWEIRDTLVWAYASGFPKSLDVSKAMDKAAGAEREVVGQQKQAQGPQSVTRRAMQSAQGYRPDGEEFGQLAGDSFAVTAPATDLAREWQGWGTALKPAWEPIVLARKPLRGTVAGNVTEYGTGALNIDGCRIGTSGATTRSHQADYAASGWRTGHDIVPVDAGRWPANVILTDPIFDGDTPGVVGGEDDSRFFLIPKAARTDREPVLGGLIPGITNEQTPPGTKGANSPRAGAGRGGLRGNVHPTVKPTDLMRHLVRLVTPPGGTVLDPFLGSGSTGLAAEMEGFEWVGIEREAEYVAIAEARLNGTQRGLGLAV